MSPKYVLRSILPVLSATFSPLSSTLCIAASARPISLSCPPFLFDPPAVTPNICRSLTPSIPHIALSSCEHLPDDVGTLHRSHGGYFITVPAIEIGSLWRFTPGISLHRVKAQQCCTCDHVRINERPGRPLPTHDLWPKKGVQIRCT